jgi:hypothetical protein
MAGGKLEVTFNPEDFSRLPVSTLRTEEVSQPQSCELIGPRATLAA